MLPQADSDTVPEAGLSRITLKPKDVLDVERPPATG